MKRTVLAVSFLLFLPLASYGQGFSSGSTGADGPLDLSTTTCPSTTFGCQIQLPESGIFNFTTVNIPTGKTLSFIPNLRNTPVVILAQGSVTIGGTIQISAGIDYVHRTALITAPGPGGFAAGGPFQNGLGPGGGTSTDRHGKWVGSLSLVPIIGGSGGYAGNGGGGGAIVIASSTSITVNGSVLAIGVACGVCNGGGSGGAIRLVANSVSVSGNLSAYGSSALSAGHPGLIRLEGPAGSLFFTGFANPSPILSTSINPQIIPDSTTPSLRIGSIAGYPVSYTIGSPNAVDLMLPNQLVDPINVVVQAQNIPVGTQVNLNISGPTQGTFTPGTLSGTQASSSATIAVSGLSRTGATYVIAFADFTLPANMAKVNLKGPDQIAKVRVITKPGTDSKLVFLRRNGTEINRVRVPKAIQQQFGLN